MADYKKMYIHLFNAITDALVEHIRGNYIDAECILKKAQLRAEQIYEETETTIVTIAKPETATYKEQEE